MEEQAQAPAEPQAEEVVNHPRHYLGRRCMEVIDVIENFELDFSKGNAVKYILRAGKKDGEDEKIALQKARWYIERRLMQLRSFK